MNEKIENAIKVLDMTLKTEELQCVLDAIGNNSKLGKRILDLIQSRKNKAIKRSEIKGVQEAIDKLNNSVLAIVYYDIANNRIYTESYNTQEELTIAFNTRTEGVSLVFTLTDEYPIENGAEKIIKQIIAMI